MGCRAWIRGTTGPSASRLRAALVATVAAWGCSPPANHDACGPGAYADARDGACFCEPGFHGDPTIECAPHGDLCAEAGERMQHTVCAHTIDDVEQWTQLSLGGGAPLGGIRRMGKFMVPVGGSARLPTVFADANSYRLHYCLMSSAFAPLFPGLTTADHAGLILTHAGREFYAGAIYELQSPDSVGYAFSVETAIRPEEMLSPEEVYTVHRQLADRFAPGDLGYFPRGMLQEETAAGWTDPPVVVVGAHDDEIVFEAYTTGIAYGRVRTNPSGAHGDYSWQDIVVFDEVPFGLEGVLAAAVTGQRQDILSHLNVLSAQRGTPNIFVDDAIAVFEQFEGELVRIEAEPYRYELTLATQAEAEAYWQTQRPAAAVENPAQYDHQDLDAFASIPTATLEQRALARSRFGAKTVGLATLSQLIEPRYQTPGFGVPFHYYDEFMTSNAWEVDLGDGPAMHSYADTIDAWLQDDEFRTDAALRKEWLARLREQMRTRGVVSPTLVQALRERIALVFGDESVMVRFRSSSNAEDSPSFNGAGLYDSTSACAADVVEDEQGSSACDAGSDVRTIERALAKVWASLWNYGAFEERDYYQLDHRAIAMGATVSLRFEHERANGVAFTGNPIDLRQPVFTVNAQAGETDVVSATPGITAELSLLTIDQGEVTGIERVSSSSLVASDELVVSDAHLRELGGLMAQLEASYPADVQLEGPTRPLLDLEFKITRDDALVIKQIRTFVPSSYSPNPSCRN